MSCPKFFSVLLLAALAALILSCGGGNSTLSRSSSINPFSKVNPNVLTREGELAKLEALQKPANLSNEQWGDLKAAMTAVIPNKVVCAPPSEDEAVTDFTFTRDAEGVGSLSWSYWLRHDYNRDGIVDAADVTEIATHFGEAVEDSPANWIIDTSGDGFVGVSDVTGIATRYGLSLLNFSLRNYTSETQFVELQLVSRGDASYDETGVMHFSIPYDSIDWVDLAVVPQDMIQSPGPASNMVLFHPVRIQSVAVPTGKVGDEGTFSVEVLGAEPIAYDWVLTNACNPKRSTDAEVDVTLVNQGLFNGKVTVSNIFGDDEWQFQVIVGVPPTITGVTPDVGATGERLPFSATVTGSGPLQYNWTFNGGFPATGDDTAPIVEFDGDGSHTCSLSVSNGYGTDSLQFNVVTGSKPQVVQVTPVQGGQGQTVQFSAEVLGSQPISYGWDFAYMSDPPASSDARPIVQITRLGNFLCKLTATNEFGATDYWFNFFAGQPPDIRGVYFTSTGAGTSCYFFADVFGDVPITLTWTLDLWTGEDPPQPALVVTGNVPFVVLPTIGGSYDCNVTANSVFGLFSYDFQMEIMGGVN